MKNGILLLCFIGCISCTNSPISKSKNTVAIPDTLSTDLYYLSYFFEDDQNNILWTIGTKRELYEDSSFCLLNYELGETKNYNYKMCFDGSGVPLGRGTKEEYKLITADKVELDFKGKDTIVYLDTKQLADPSKLWFWNVKPELEETVAVESIMKNFITNSIDFKTIFHQYIGNENLTMDDKTYKSYKVKSWTEGQPEDIFDERWFNDEGILIKELHHVGANGTRVAQLNI